MKKVFAILALATVMVACNNESATEDAAKKAADSTRVADSLKAEADKAAAATAASDSLKVAADSLKVAADSLKK